MCLGGNIQGIVNGAMARLAHHSGRHGYACRQAGEGRHTGRCMNAGIAPARHADRSRQGGQAERPGKSDRLVQAGRAGQCSKAGRWEGQGRHGKSGKRARLSGKQYEGDRHGKAVEVPHTGRQEAEGRQGRGCKAGSRKGKSNREAGKVRPTGMQLGKGWTKQGGRQGWARYVRKWGNARTQNRHEGTVYACRHVCRRETD